MANNSNPGYHEILLHASEIVKIKCKNRSDFIMINDLGCRYIITGQGDRLVLITLDNLH